METKAQYAAVGAFVLVLAIGLLVAVLWLGGVQYGEESAHYRTYFSGSVTGLGTGTIVRYNGIQVGTVGKLEFDPNDPRRVVVTLKVSPSLPIHSDSVASIASEGLTGGAYIEIDGGSKKAEILPIVLADHGEMPVIRSTTSGFQQIEQSAPLLVAKLNVIADRLNDVLNDKNRAAIAGILDHTNNTMAVFDRNSKNFDTTFANLATASRSLDGDLTSLHGVLASAGQTTQKLNKVMDSLDTQVNGAQLGQLASDTRALELSLTNLSNKIAHEPTSILFGDRRKGYTPP
jgi:phospholipid/cholesterol/gamma-HCH transport system substrate-binding protein